MSTAHSSGRPAYDAIGSRYHDVKSLPAAGPERHTVLSAVGDFDGCEVLDLACGTGYYSRLARERGAKRVVGVDVSPAMIEAARTHDRERAIDGIEYLSHDALDLPRLGSFDIVLGVWLLNYSTDLAELTSMLSGIRSNLTPGGRFVGVTQNPWYRFGDPQYRRFGWTFEPLETGPGGTRAWATAHTVEPVSFAVTFLPPEHYEAGARNAGLDAPLWHAIQTPPTENAERAELHRQFRENPCLAALSLRKSSPDSWGRD